MTHLVGAKGQVVIPKAIRDELGLAPGSSVEFVREEDSVRVMRASDRPTRGLRGRYAGSGMAAALLADRAAEPR